MTTLPAAITAWIHAQATAFRTHQLAAPFARTIDGRHATPEEECVAWVLRALAVGGCPATDAVLEMVDRQRACAKEAT